jgi:hypothetical protein
VEEAQMSGPTNEGLLKVHLATFVSMALVAGGLLGANLRVNSAAIDFGMQTLSGVGALTEFFFYRGWPLSPCQICLFHGMRFRPEGGFPVGLALALDVAVAGLVLLGVAVLCELVVRRLRRVRA